MYFIVYIFYLYIAREIVTKQVQSSGFTVQWLFAEPLTVKCGFFMSRFRSLGMDNGSWVQRFSPARSMAGKVQGSPKL